MSRLTFTLTQVHFSEFFFTFTLLLWATLLSLLYLNAILVKNTSIYSKHAIYFSLGNERCPFANDSFFWVNSVQRIDQTSESVRESVWMIRLVPCTHALSRFSLRVVTESLKTSRALSAAARDLFQEECLCLDTINIDIFTAFMLAEI